MNAVLWNFIIDGRMINYYQKQSARFIYVKGGKLMYTDDKVLYADVAIIGGGSAGSSAAITAARNGLSAILLEQHIALGGEMTNGYVGGIAGVREGNAKEFVERLDKRGMVKPSNLCPLIDSERAKLELESMVVGAGARVLYEATVYDVEMGDDNKIKAVFAYCRGTRVKVIADMFIDASGDANVAAMAGAPVEYSTAEFSGYSSASSLACRIAHVDIVKWEAAKKEWDEQQEKDGVPKEKRITLDRKLLLEAEKNGDLSTNFVAYKKALATQMSRIAPGLDPDLDHDRTTVWYFKSFNCKNTDIEDLTRQILEQHRQMDYCERFLNKYCPGFENAKLSTLPCMNGVRDSRRIRGEYVFSGRDMVEQARFEDCIARFDDMFDLHHPVDFNVFMRHIHLHGPAGEKGFYSEPTHDLNMHPYCEPEGIEGRTDPKGYCEIPYRCIVPLKVDNLFVVGRCYSADFYALSGARLIATMMSLGQAAAVATKLCKDEGVTPRKLDGKKVHKYLMDVEGVPLETPTPRMIEKANMPGKPYYNKQGDNMKYK